MPRPLHNILYCHVVLLRYFYGTASPLLVTFASAKTTDDDDEDEQDQEQSRLLL